MSGAAGTHAPNVNGVESGDSSSSGPTADGRPASQEIAEAPRADPSRIGERLAAIARIGADPSGEGISRLAYTPAEREAHALVGGWLRDLGLDVRVDAAGNTIAERPGSRAGAPALGIGSHLDSVPHGGRFDGIVGVVGAVELVRLLAERDETTLHPIRVVVFAGEEGARFGEPCLGSKGVVGDLAARDLAQVRDGDGVSLADAMRSVGLDPGRVGAARWRADDWAVFLELHIEQARTLEDEARAIGIVDTISGSTRLRLDIEGRADHSGGTPMGMRQDALVAASEIVLLAETLARDPHNRGARLTVGRLDVHPNSITTIPGHVRLTVDVRDVDPDRQRQLAIDVVRRARAVAERRGVGVDTEVIADTSPVVLPIWIRELTSRICEEQGLGYRVMTSGAGHDAQVVNAIVPAGMVFVPSRGGLSHVPEEWTSASEVARGVDVLHALVLGVDRLLESLEAVPAAGS